VILHDPAHVTSHALAPVQSMVDPSPTVTVHWVLFEQS
jgi:hypothetical protein